METPGCTETDPKGEVYQAINVWASRFVEHVATEQRGEWCPYSDTPDECPACLNGGNDDGVEALFTAAVLRSRYGLSC